MSAKTPLLTDRGRAMLHRLREHADAPRWNREVGDRLTLDDLAALDEFRGALDRQRAARSVAVPPSIVEWVARRRPHVAWFGHALRGVGDLESDWSRVRTMSRAELAVRPWDLIPDDADLDAMVVYQTSGTTGHIVRVPYDPRAAAQNVPLIERALAHYGLEPRFDADQIACFLIGAQAHTVTYPAVLTAWREAGFCKLNLKPSEWPSPDSVHRYFRDNPPVLLTGDPISFGELLRLGVEHRPIAALSTAVAMSQGLARRLRAAYDCPIIDWYSLTETGPLAFQCRQGFFHQLPHDVYLEVLRADGTPCDDGERGEITVTGGRNPFVPLLRYRTGDYGRLDHAPCGCGDPMPRLLELEGRPPVLFRTPAGEPVNPVDLSRVLRDYALVQHELFQRADGSCDLVLRPVAGSALDVAALSAELSTLLGGVEIRARIDETLGDKQPGKIVPYRSELFLDE